MGHLAHGKILYLKAYQSETSLLYVKIYYKTISLMHFFEILDILKVQLKNCVFNPKFENIETQKFLKHFCFSV